MRPAAKAGIVVAGYVAAVAVASLVLRVYIAATSGPDRQTYGGMYAFGDSLLFLGVAGVAAIPATGAAASAGNSGILRVSAEGQEGLTAFLDKRSPNWIDSPPR